MLVLQVPAGVEWGPGGGGEGGKGGGEEGERGGGGKEGERGFKCYWLWHATSPLAPDA